MCIMTFLRGGCIIYIFILCMVKFIFYKVYFNSCVYKYITVVFLTCYFFSQIIQTLQYIYTQVYIIFHCHTIEHEQIFIVSQGYCYVYYYTCKKYCLTFIVHLELIDLLSYVEICTFLWELVIL